MIARRSRRLRRVAQQCGGDFATWKAELRQEAVQAGVGANGLAALADADISQKVLAADHAQGVFTQSFVEFAGRMINSYRLKHGAEKLKQYAGPLRRGRAPLWRAGAGDHRVLGAGDRFRRRAGQFRHARRAGDAVARLPPAGAVQAAAHPSLEADRRRRRARACPGRLGRRDRPDPDAALRHPQRRRRRRRRRHRRREEQRARRDPVHRQQARQAGLEGGRAVDRSRSTCPPDMPWGKTSIQDKLPISQYIAWGVKARGGAPLDPGLPARRAGAADGPQRRRLPRLRQLRRLPSVEPVLRLHADGRQPGDALCRRAKIRPRPCRRRSDRATP